MYTDNKNVHIVCSGSNVDESYSLYLKVHEICAFSNIPFVTRWIPREDNTKAEYLSRCLDSDDWFISYTVFLLLDSSFHR